MLWTKDLNSCASSSSFAGSVETAPSESTFAATKIGASTLIATAIASDGRQSISKGSSPSLVRTKVANYVSFSTSSISTFSNS